MKVPSPLSGSEAPDDQMPESGIGQALIKTENLARGVGPPELRGAGAAASDEAGPQGIVREGAVEGLGERLDFGRGDEQSRLAGHLFPFPCAHPEGNLLSEHLSGPRFHL